MSYLNALLQNVMLLTVRLVLGAAIRVGVNQQHSMVSSFVADGSSLITEHQKTLRIPRQVTLYTRV